jgi:hypothetical protein
VHHRANDISCSILTDVVKCSDILEECTGLIEVDAKVIWGKKCVGHIG